MIDFYTWTTPNGRKIAILLEELGLAYRVHEVNIGADDQFKPEFLAISPNNKIPAIVDPDGPEGPISVFESAAIGIYLCEKTRSDLLPADTRRRVAVLEWCMFQMASLGPMFGQLGHFTKYAKVDVPYAASRYRDESRRILDVMDRRLAEYDYLAGDYSLADILCYPWVLAAFDGLEEANPGLTDDLAGVERWLSAIGERPAIVAGMAVPPR